MTRSIQSRQLSSPLISYFWYNKSNQSSRCFCVVLALKKVHSPKLIKQFCSMKPKHNLLARSQANQGAWLSSPVERNHQTFAGGVFTTNNAKCKQPTMLNANNLLCFLSPAALLPGWKMFSGDIPPPCGSQTTETMVPKILSYPGNLMLAGECRSLVSARGGSITREDVSNSSNSLSDHLERQTRVTISDRPDYTC